MAFRAQKLSGTFDKRTPVLLSRRDSEEQQYGSGSSGGRQYRSSNIGRQFWSGNTRVKYRQYRSSNTLAAVPEWQYRRGDTGAAIPVQLWNNPVQNSKIRLFQGKRIEMKGIQFQKKLCVASVEKKTLK